MMNHMSKTARLLDRLCIFLYWTLILTTAVSILAVVFLTVNYLRTGAFLKLDRLTLLHFGNLNVMLAPDALREAIRPGFEPWLLVLFLLVPAALWIYFLMVSTVRDILKPFINRTPFQETVAKNLSRLAALMVINAALSVVGTLIVDHTIRHFLDLSKLFITGQQLIFVGWENTSIEAAPFIFAAVLFLLSKVFQYGQELQTLSDETL